MRLRIEVLLIAMALIVLAGCERQQAQEPVEPPETEVAAQEESDAVHLTAYINVTSGCQKPTVELVKELRDRYEDSISVEIVDFGSPEGLKRWQGDGIKCMALLFDGSPVLRIPDEAGGERTVVFYFPPGFDWTHSDLEQAFAAIASGEAEILSEEEARKALAPKPVEVQVEVQEVADGAQVLMNGETAFTITQKAGDQTPLQRAQAAADAIAEWTDGPVHPTQLGAIDAAQGWSIVADGRELVRVYPVDAEAAGVEPKKKHAAKWLGGIKANIVAAARDNPQGDGE